MHIAFLVYKLDKSRLLTTEFYRQDIEVLKSLGHRVTIATSLRETPRDADLVFLWWWSWLWLVGPVLKLWGKPICVTGSLEPDIYEKRSFAYRFLVRNGMRFADRSVFVSRYMVDRLSRIMRLRGARLCPHIVMDEYRPATAENERAEADTIFNVAWQTGRNMRRKMLPELVEAFAIVHRKRPQTRLVLAGEPMDGGPQLVALAERRGVRHAVDFLGKVTKEDKIRRMQRCGVYYQCSRHEGFGVAIAEAMACGAPVVVNRKTAIPEVVGDCGRYVRDETPEAIAEALLSVLEDPEGSRKTGRAAARRVDEEFRFARRREFFRELFLEMGLPQEAARGARAAA